MSTQEYNQNIADYNQEAESAGRPKKKMKMEQPRSIEQDNEAALAYNRAAAKKGEMMKKLKVESGTPVVAPAWVKPTQLILDITTAVSFLISLFTGGLELIDVSVFLLSGNGQILLDTFVPVYRMKKWKKYVIVIMDVIILTVLMFVFGFVAMLVSDPAEICSQLGTAIGGEVLGWLAKGTCFLGGGGVIQFIAQ